MSKLVQLLILACVLAAGHSHAAAVLSPIPGLNAIKGPELRFGATPAARPVWTVEVNRNTKGQLIWQYAAVDPDGKRLGTFGHVDRPVTGGQAYAVSWAPDGRRYAFTSVTKADGSQVNIKSVDGGQKVVRVNGPRIAVPWQVAWSPDGRRLAFLAYTREKGKKTGHSLIIMDTDSSVLKNPFIAEYPVPSATLADFPPLMAPPDKLRWSPDGQRILVSWGNVVAINVRDGALTTIHTECAAATWTPRGDGVLYLAVSGWARPPRQWTGLFLQRFDGAGPVQIADAAGLSELGFRQPGPNSGILDLSPDGKSLALAGGDGYSRYAIHIFPVEADGTVHLETPRGTWNYPGTAMSLDWAPTGRDIAMVLISPESVVRGSQTIDATMVIYREAGDQQQLGRVQLPASPASMDFLGQTRVLSWSR